MQRTKERTVWSILLAAVLVISLAGYLIYVQRQFYDESTQNLLETYEQVDKTFTMFAQRNWNVLGEWGKTLERDETSTERYQNLKQFNEEKEQPFALFYLDLDKFKPVNDTYGHDMGDQLLKAVADRLRGCIRSTDLAFRIGGDEFALIVNGTLDDAWCEERVEKIKSVIRQPYVLAQKTIEVGTSCGFAVYPADSADVRTIRILADHRMYQDKEKTRSGRV